jgi:type VI secretion system secreted protein VgrG
VRAHTDAQQIWSEQDLTVQSTTDEVRIQASKSITLTAGQSQVVIEGGNITFTCPGTWTVKGATHDWGGGGSGAAVLPLLPSGQVGITPDPARHDQFFVLRWANSGRPMKQQGFRLRRADGSLQSGVTDANGRSPILDTASKEELLTVEVLRESVAS